ncbi:THUMP domain-containing class I SAM-dependent RNA methyltransferase [Candidatus Soleaferrea massiliensis]|uniref:THUMP domain-containing class I SAM-dependent RNA methyltransferase n=1 Tax=Candidatus Soleaferrea massiliensis TaxID=1470354 RepID=UPI000590FA64|nr:class I SAM-dependent RNA methyltransferase [Candidatus Soleaferrea massiliensis]
MDELVLSCPCHFGLESVLAGEIKRAGKPILLVSDGRVSFTGGLRDIAWANIHLRTAERVQIILKEGKVYSFEDLFQLVSSIPFEDFIGKSDAFPVKGYALKSQLHSVPDCQAIIKKAIVSRLQDHYHLNWFEETGPVHQIQFSILKDKATIMLDTTGAGLHKRGYRKNANEAPIKETLAAGIIDIAKVKPYTVLYDPFCGSGTFLIEAAAKALHIAPGFNRRFACEQWGLFSDGLFAEERKNAIAQIKRDAPFKAYGFDISEECLELSRDNAKKAGVLPRIRFQQQDIKDFTAPEGPATVICNPPYGERMLEIKEAERLYREMGRVFERTQGVNYYIISPHEEFERLFGRQADKRRKLYNGMIKCQLYMYFK